MVKIKLVLADKPLRMGRDRRAVRGELQSIKRDDADGLLKADAVVSRASDDANPLHPFFEWDDGKAAHQHRLAQARALIRSVEVVMPEDSDESPIPKFVSLRFDRSKVGGGYRETQDVVKDRKFLTELEATAKQDIDAFLRRYEMLKEFCAKVRAAIN